MRGFVLSLVIVIALKVAYFFWPDAWCHLMVNLGHMLAFIIFNHSFVQSLKICDSYKVFIDLYSYVILIFVVPFGLKRLKTSAVRHFLLSTDAAMAPLEADSRQWFMAQAS